MGSEVQQLLLSRAQSLAAEFQQRRQTQQIHEAINFDRKALELCPPGHPDRSAILIYLAEHLRDRYTHLGATTDIEESVVLSREALSQCPPGHSLRPTALNNLVNCLSSRYNQLGSMHDLDEAIVLARKVLDLCPPGHSLRTTALNNLANCLSNRSRQVGSMQDLGEAIVLARKVLSLCPPGHGLRSAALNNLANYLSNRYNQLGSMQDLGEAIVFAREVLGLCPLGHSLRPTALNNLAIYLSHRYNQLGSMQDLEEAMILARKVLSLCPPGHSLRSTALNNLANYLSHRYNQLGSMQDLEEAMILARKVLSLCPPEHGLRSTALNSLASCLFNRYNQLGSMKDLGEAIVLGREALSLRPPGHSLRPIALNNLAGFLYKQYDQLGSMQDLDEAIVHIREALGLCPPGHSVRSTALNSLANCLSDRYQQLGSMQDLDEAITLARKVLDIFPQGHPNRSQVVANITTYLYQRFTRSGQIADKEELFILCSQLVHVDQFVSSSHLSAARAWIRMAEHFQHPTLLLAYETSLRLLAHHLAILPSLPQHLSILKKHTSSLAVDAFSTCLHNCAPAHAVELLEQGRGVFWSQLTRLHSPLHDIRASGPAGEKLADKFTHLSFLIRNALNSPDIDQHEQMCRLNVEMQMVVTNIRELPGLSRFLLPSLFSDLQRAASAGPVIIVNASEFSCDALIVLHNREPIHVPFRVTQDDVQGMSAELHKLTERAKKSDVTRELVIFLRELWDQIVSPIVHFLQTTVPSQSRIWWCPTGEFSRLPLHAAGPFRNGQQNLHALYISSYTPTLAALIRARRCDPAVERKRFVAIGLANVAGESELPSVAEELDMIGHRVDGLAAFTRVDGKSACISRVVEELGRNEWVHVACHGIPKPERPFESAFALQDGRFTIQRIIGCDLKNAEFAYLSACHTTVGDKESPDEAIHLASAMQFIGFRSVIGTMWAVDDAGTKKITPTFYDHLVDESGRLDYTRAAYALNKTTGSVRTLSLDQRILYIHLGA